MSRKKGMSREEKLTAMQALMMESNTIWTLKELEKDCPKKKGIISQSVKEILQELCDNDLVSFDKIGSGNFYWCFPSEAYNRRKVTETKLLQEISSYESEIAQLESEIAELAPARVDSEERDQLNSEIAELEKQLSAIAADSSKYEKMNPDAIRKIQRQSATAIDAANRWTDNIFTVRSYCAKQFAIPNNQFNEKFEIDEDFDYIE